MKLSTLITELRALQTRLPDGGRETLVSVQVEDRNLVVDVERIYGAAILGDWYGKTRVVLVPMKPLIQLPDEEKAKDE